jgi:hypothetical protein
MIGKRELSAGRTVICLLLALLIGQGCRDAPVVSAPRRGADRSSGPEHPLPAAGVNPDQAEIVAAARGAGGAVRGVRGALGTYDAMPRDLDGRNSLAQMIDELVELRARTYNYLVYHTAADWDDLKKFLPMARAKNIQVWVTVMAPSESPPHFDKFSEPFRLDYERWASEIAQLSVENPNLVAWSIDDFTSNLSFFTPARLRRMRAASQRVNPALAFVPCCYYRHVDAAFAADYGGLIDGILFPYRAESDERPNLSDPSRVHAEVRRLRSVLGASVPIIVDVYASPVSRMGESTPAYVREVMTAALRSADGVLVFRSPQKGSTKWDVIREQFQAD